MLLMLVLLIIESTDTEISVVTGERRVTIRAMKRAAAILVLAVLAAVSLASCGPSEEPADSGALEDAQQAADEANESVADLETRVEDLVAEIDRLAADGRSLSKKFERIHKDLRDSIANVRSSLSDASSDAQAARASADSALGEVEAALERMAVLENRFDYHLRSDP